MIFVIITEDRRTASFLKSPLFWSLCFAALLSAKSQLFFQFLSDQWFSGFLCNFIIDIILIFLSSWASFCFFLISHFLSCSLCNPSEQLWPQFGRSFLSDSWLSEPDFVLWRIENSEYYRDIFFQDRFCFVKQVFVDNIIT